MVSGTMVAEAILAGWVAMLPAQAVRPIRAVEARAMLRVERMGMEFS